MRACGLSGSQADKLQLLRVFCPAALCAAALALILQRACFSAPRTLTRRTSTARSSAHAPGGLLRARPQLRRPSSALSARTLPIHAEKALVALGPRQDGGPAPDGAVGPVGYVQWPRLPLEPHDAGGRNTPTPWLDNRKAQCCYSWRQSKATRDWSRPMDQRQAARRRGSPWCLEAASPNFNSHIRIRGSSGPAP